MKSFLPIILILLGSACSNTQAKPNLWPVENGFPQDAPKLEIPEKGTELRQAQNGFLYAVGDLSDAKMGSPFYARYGGSWPIDDLKRPPLALGHLVKKINEKIAIVALDYKYPEANLIGAKVTWEKAPLDERVGKGIAPPVIEPKESEKKLAEIKLSIGEQSGVQKGDIYAIASRVPDPKRPTDIRISKRIKAICMVSAVSQDSSTCKLWYGSSQLQRVSKLRSDDIAIFMEHTFGGPASPSSIELLTIVGDENDTLRTVLHDAFSKTLDALPQRKTKLINSPLSGDPTLPSFYKIADQYSKVQDPKIAVGGKVVSIDGDDHLIVNYSSVGSSRGPGMSAAPPENGIDLGPINKLDPRQVTKFAELVWSSVLVNRGRSSEALIHLRYMLNDINLRGPMRWHIRDQYAMRWAALDHTQEALWLVTQDEDEAGEDRMAELNALGTKVRLLDMLGANARASVASKKYFEARKSKQDTLYFGAFSMHIEMLLKAERIDEAKTLVQKLIASAPSEELAALLGGIYWGIPTPELEFRKAILKEISSRTSSKTPRLLASLRISQGLLAFEQNLHDDALLALLDAEETYVALNSPVGVARVNYFMFIANLARKEPQRAFEHALKSININRSLDDFPASVRMYERLAELYSVFPSPLPNGPYLGAANDVLSAFFQTQVAQGNFGKAAKALFIHGTFLTHLTKFDDAQSSLRKASTYAIKTANFDIAALCHIRLAVVAKAQRDQKTFADELKRAAKMAEISGDPTILKIIWNIMNPEKSQEAPQLL